MGRRLKDLKNVVFHTHTGFNEPKERLWDNQGVHLRPQSQCLLANSLRGAVLKARPWLIGPRTTTPHRPVRHLPLQVLPPVCDLRDRLSARGRARDLKDHLRNQRQQRGYNNTQ